MEYDRSCCIIFCDKIILVALCAATRYSSASNSSMSHITNMNQSLSLMLQIRTYQLYCQRRRQLNSQLMKKVLICINTSCEYTRAELESINVFKHTFS